METTQPPTERSKRGRRKDSTKAKAEKDAASAGGVKGSDGDEKNTAIDEDYDLFFSRDLVSPVVSCRWGPVLEEDESKTKQLLYLSEHSEQTNKLIIAEYQFLKPRVFLEDGVAEAHQPYMKNYKTILHPGQVNRIREWPKSKNIIATHSDRAGVFIWDVKAQRNRNRAVLGDANSSPDLVLSGHKHNTKFALAMCPAEPFVLSGGKDKFVVLWSIQDHVSTLARDGVGSSSIVKAAHNSAVRPQMIFRGHTDTVEDVQFCPSSSQQFCTVGDDSCLILWDAKIGRYPVVKVKTGQNADLHCVDWNSHDENYILTGSADSTVCMFDRRMLTANGIGTPLHTFSGHKAAVRRVQWSPRQCTVFGSSAEDGLLNIWDYEKVGQIEQTGLKFPGTPELFTQHARHRCKVVDFHWNCYDPSMFVSVSDDRELGGHGTLQMWRMTNMARSRRMTVMVTYAPSLGFDSHEWCLHGLNIIDSHKYGYQEFNENQLMGLEEDFAECWPNLGGNKETPMRRHQWSRHGVHSGLDVNAYFKLTIDLFRQIPTNALLGLTSGRAYSVQQVRELLRQNFVAPAIKGKKSDDKTYIQELHFYCLDGVFRENTQETTVDKSNALRENPFISIQLPVKPLPKEELWHGMKRNKKPRKNKKNNKNKKRRFF